MPTVTGIDINTDPVIVAQLQTQPSLVSRPLIYPGCKSSPCASFSPSRVYVSPLWRRSTTADGLLSLPPFSAVLWRRWWSGRVNSSQTGNCPGCRFSFPSTFSLWAELRQRASSGKTDPTQSMTCLNSSSNCAVLKIKGDLMYQCAHCVVCIVHLNVCVWSPLATYFSALSPWAQYTEQTAEKTLPGQALFWFDTSWYVFTLQLKPTSTWELHSRVFV